jgi:hypothetical protein
VTYHKGKRLAEIVVPELPGNRPDKEVSTYDDWLADFRSMFHMLEPADNYAECLQVEPVPRCCSASQQMARLLRDQQSNGVVFPLPVEIQTATAINVWMTVSMSVLSSLISAAIR